MIDILLNLFRHTTSAEEQQKIDGTKIHPEQIKNKGTPLEINPNGISEVGFTGKKEKDYLLLEKKYNKIK
ncbi:MAG: hypothetical protein ACI4OT_01725 [Bacilli bacterium]